MIRQPSYKDLLHVARHLRAVDVIELSLTRKDSPTRLALDAWRTQHRMMAYLGDEPVFAFGVALGEVSGHGQAWGFGTDKSPRVLREVTKYLRKRMIPALIGEGLSIVQALADPDNRVSARWLYHLGFTPHAKLAGIGAGGHDLVLWVTTADAQHRHPVPVAA